MESILAYVQENGSESSFMSTAVWIATVAGLWKMFEKTGEPGWTGIIPCYNMYKLCQKVMGDPWYWLRLLVFLIPVIGWVAFIYFRYQIGKATARAFGQDDIWAWGYTFLEPVCYCITGFGNYKYYGVQGIGDSRTEDARRAKTVDFDVVKMNEIDDNVVINDVRPEAPERVEEVEFTLDRKIDD